MNLTMSEEGFLKSINRHPSSMTPMNVLIGETATNKDADETIEVTLNVICSVLSKFVFAIFSYSTKSANPYMYNDVVDRKSPTQYRPVCPSALRLFEQKEGIVDTVLLIKGVIRAL